MNQPTEAQLQRFWTWCGFEPKIGGVLGHERIVQWRYPNGERRAKCPRITLDNLFKWAMPKLDRSQFTDIMDEWGLQVWYKDDAALALFWAIWPRL